MHQRFKPRSHRLLYRVFYLLLDIDEIGLLDRSLRLFSHNRFNLLSFRDRDYGDGSGSALRGQVEQRLAAAGIAFDGGVIQILTMPRILGYAFNPLNIYFCFQSDLRPAAIIYEVNNTFGQRHSYVIPASSASRDTVYQESMKTLHVSPFLSTDMTYAFAIGLPRERLTLSIVASTPDGPEMTAKLAARRETLCDATLLRAFCLYPLMTLKVILGIHWEALRIWLKGASFHRLPVAPRRSMTIGRERQWREARCDDRGEIPSGVDIGFEGSTDYVRE